MNLGSAVTAMRSGEQLISKGFGRCTEGCVQASPPRSEFGLATFGDPKVNLTETYMPTMLKGAPGIEVHNLCYIHPPGRKRLGVAQAGPACLPV